jgi:hypothetical protein
MFSEERKENKRAVFFVVSGSFLCNIVLVQG